MRACWAATLLVLVQPSRATCATCLGTSVVPRVLALTHRHPHKSPCVQRPFVAICGSIAFSSLWFLSRKLCPIFVCQFKGSLHLARKPKKLVQGFDVENRNHIAEGVDVFLSTASIKSFLSRMSLDVIGSGGAARAIST